MGQCMESKKRNRGISYKSYGFFLYTRNRAYSLGFYPRRPQHGQSVRDKTGMNPSFQPFSYDVH